MSFDFGTKKKKRGKKTMVSLDDDGSAQPVVEAVEVNKEETVAEAPVVPEGE
jgi:ribosomal protein S26